MYDMFEFEGLIVLVPAAGFGPLSYGVTSLVTWERLPVTDSEGGLAALDVCGTGTVSTAWTVRHRWHRTLERASERTTVHSAHARSGPGSMRCLRGANAGESDRPVRGAGV